MRFSLCVALLGLATATKSFDMAEDDEVAALSQENEDESEEMTSLFGNEEDQEYLIQMQEMDDEDDYEKLAKRDILEDNGITGLDSKSGEESD